MSFGPTAHSREPRLLPPPPPALRVDRVRAGPDGGEEEEDEREEGRGLAAVLDRPEGAGRVLHEVRDRELAGEDEGDRPREEAERDEHAADQLHHTGERVL